MKNKFQIIAIFWMILATNTPNATATDGIYNWTPVCSVSQDSVLQIEHPITVVLDTHNPMVYRLPRQNDPRNCSLSTVRRSGPARLNESLGSGPYKLVRKECTEQLASLTFRSASGIEFNISCQDGSPRATIADIKRLLGADNIYFSGGTDAGSQNTRLYPRGLKPSGRRTGQQGPKLEDSSTSDSRHPVRLPPEQPWVDTTPTDLKAPSAR